MTRLLAIESSAEACSVALFCDGAVRTFFEHAPMRHAELLLPAVHSLLDEAAVPLASLDAIAFGRGPGSFTSLRIGIGVVQGLAWAADIPVVPVSSLAAVAQAACDAATPGPSSICVAVDARMQEVYSGNFRRDPGGMVVADGEERVGPPERVRALPGGAFIAAGNGFERFMELNPLVEQSSQYLQGVVPRAESIGRLALDWLTRNTGLPAGKAQPVYVRNDVASKPGSD